MTMNKLKYFILSMIVLVPGLVSGQDGSSAGLLEQYKFEVILGIMVLVCIVALLALIVAWWGLRVVVRARLEEQGVTDHDTLIKARPGEEHLGFWAKFWDRFNSAVPVAHEANVETNHSYDGIRELDNRLPPWWLYGFYFTIAFGVIYWLRFEVFESAPSQHEEYVASMQQAEEQVQAYLASMTEEDGDVAIELLSDDAALAAGQTIFKANCAQCHAADGGGMTGLGPNLTDKYWKNGGDFSSIASVVQGGVSGTSMIAWESQLGPAKIAQVASYVYSLEGTTPANPKDPEGELFEREEMIEEEVASDSTAVAGL